MLLPHLEHRLHRTGGAGVGGGSGGALLVICGVAFVVGLDITIVNVAVPAMGSSLDASTADLQWIVDSYNIALAGLILLGAALGEHLSRKWVFLFGLLLFLVGTTAAGLSTAVGPLIAARSIQGIGAALLLTPALSLIAEIFPPDKRARAIAWWATAGALGVAIGPVAGGLLVSTLSWNWIFFVNVPALLVFLIVGSFVLPGGSGQTRGRLDVIGAVLSVLGFALLLGGLIEGPRWSWSPPVLLAIVTGGVIVAAFVIWELRSTLPMFDIRVLAERPVTAAALALFTTYIAFTGILFLVPQHLQGVDAYSVLVAGLAMVPLAVVFWLASRVAPRIAEHIGTSRALILGLAFISSGFALLAATAPASSLLLVILATCVSAIGWGLTIPLGSVVILNSLPATKTGSAAGTSMFSRFAGAAVGVALLGTALSSAYGFSLQPTLDSLGYVIPAGASGSLQQTMSFAATLPEPARSTLVAAADSAFVDASMVAYLVGLAASLITLALCLWLLRSGIKRR